ncbi:hypothetical protein RSOLAG1IB_07490 [Rhizoctonia solani AG-1 IB]|uniref:Uncharacterized protein n=1 Tax=Thanatephorus cucumeris (strain AG1-IB / isolate 7/3/14) TaxID=1108050 RepID=A0A0B7FIS2_THACB|nr:hypothetical protein RSOLAG1IB_07490 [Rhizoctonia solani AG-1 IB]
MSRRPLPSEVLNNTGLLLYAACLYCTWLGLRVQLILSNDYDSVLILLNENHLGQPYARCPILIEERRMCPSPWDGI